MKLHCPETPEGGAMQATFKRQNNINILFKTYKIAFGVKNVLVVSKPGECIQILQHPVYILANTQLLPQTLQGLL